MGTNYYCRHIPTEEEYEKLQEILNKRDLQKLEEEIQNLRKEYHIGKNSFGWKFIFCPHEENGEIVSPWKNNLQSIKDYLSREDVYIYDEYGKTYTSEEFFNKMSDTLYEGYDLESYWLENPGEADYFLKDYSSFEFTSDNLRFSRTIDFG